MFNNIARTTLCIKYLAKLNTLCHSVSGLSYSLRTTEVTNVDAVIKYNSELISKLQEIQRTLLYFKNAESKPNLLPPPPPRPGPGAA